MWDVFIYLLNGLVFILIGLQLPSIVNNLEGSLITPILYAVAISIVTIVVRILWVFSGIFLSRISLRRKKQGEQALPKRHLFLIAWSGMRGVVSLASALAIPLTLSNGAAFPHRDLILFITFVVILITLVLQGLTLPFVIKKLRIKEDNLEKDEELDLAIRLQMADAVIDYMKLNYAGEIEKNEAYKRVFERYERMAENTYRRIIEGENGGAEFLKDYRRMLRELVHVKRMALRRLAREDMYSFEMVREKEWELDLEEARLDDNGSN